MMRKLLCLLALTLQAASPAFALQPGDFVTDGPGGQGKRAALSFDDGPGPYTPQVLALLKGHGVRGTFFMNGINVARMPGLARDVLEAGHEIGDHTYSHVDFHRFKEFNPVDKLRVQMSLSKKIIQETTGVAPILCRMPYGYVREWVKVVAKDQGYILVNWTFGCDWKTMEPQTKKDAYIKALRPGAIFLMHDGGKNREGTLVALEGLLEELQRQGYETVTVGELIGLTPIKN